MTTDTSEARAAAENGYPHYEMRQRLDRSSPWEVSFLPLTRAGALFDSGWVEVQIGGVVIMDDQNNARPMTEFDRKAISDAADRCSDSK